MTDDAKIERAEDLIRSYGLSSRERLDLVIALVERFAVESADFVIPGQRLCGACGRAMQGRRDKRKRNVRQVVSRRRHG